MGFDEGVRPEELRELRETEKVTQDYECMKEIHATMMDQVEGFEGQNVIVTGEPFAIAGRLDSVQGDNIYGISGNCGLVSCSNYLNLCGIKADENMVSGFALANNLCSRSVFSSKADWGGTLDSQLEKIVESYGVPSSVYHPGDAKGTIEGIANAVEEGRAVMIGINAGYLWDDANSVGNGNANHEITVTGTIRDTKGELAALTICDSGRQMEADSCRVVPVSLLHDCYTKVNGSSAVISDDAVR